MKKIGHKVKSAVVLLTLLVLTSLLIKGRYTGKRNEDIKGTITISGAWALYPMAVKWAEEFKKIHPALDIEISAGGAGKGIADCLAKIVDIGMVSRAIYPAETEKGAWPVAVTKDAVVPTINEKNPVLPHLLSKGVKKNELFDIWITARIQKWDQLVDGGSGLDINVYTRSDSCGAAETWAAYFDKRQEDLSGTGIYGDPGIANAVKKDIYGIGFNNMNYLYDQATKKQLNGIRALPIDLNENGAIDPEEDFYEERDELARAIALGKYPSPPSRDLYFVFQGRPDRDVVVTFLKWVLTDGQRYVAETGYIPLDKEIINMELNKLR